MSKDALLEALRHLAEADDPEAAHREADALLLLFLNDQDIAMAYAAVPKWYS